MLTNVAAFLMATVAFTGVPGSFVVPGVEQAMHSSEARATSYTTSASASVSAGATTSSSATTNSSAAVTPKLAPRVPLSPRLTGLSLLDGLAGLQAAAIEQFIDENPAAVAKLQLDPPSAASVTAWWRLLSAGDRSHLVSGAPEVIGNLDGVPVGLRDEANRVALDATIGSLETSISSLGRAEQGEAVQRLHMLQQIEKSLKHESGQPQRQLLSVDTEWPGRAAVVVGDLATADYVSYMVPGMFFTVDNQMVDWTVISQDLFNEQYGWVKRLAPTDTKLRSASVAVVSWIGYETPDLLEIASLDLARQGAKYIASSVHGVQSTRSTDEPYITLLTHSYGSTATMLALQDGAVTTDSLVIIGSPGSPAQSVDDLGMPADKVFVGEAAWDPVVNSAFFGSDPGSSSFGATSMDVAGEKDPITGKDLAPALGHLGYFDEGTEAMRNMALVGLDRGDLVAGPDADGYGDENVRAEDR